MTERTAKRRVPTLTRRMEFLTPKQVGEIRHKTESGLSKERLRGDGPPWVRDGHRVLYPVETFWDYMAGLTADIEEEEE
jgi:hypothetical protein